MKNYKRAQRRHQKKTKFIKRLKNWIKNESLYSDQKGGKPILRTALEVRNMALQGKCYTFLRTTGRPCNCDMCTYKKYKRENKSKVKNEIFKEILA